MDELQTGSELAKDVDNSELVTALISVLLSSNGRSSEPSMIEVNHDGWTYVLTQGGCRSETTIEHHVPDFNDPSYSICQPYEPPRVTTVSECEGEPLALWYRYPSDGVRAV